MSVPAVALSPIPDTLPMAIYDQKYQLKAGPQSLYVYLWLYFKENGCFPSRAECLSALGVGPEAYSSYLKVLKEKGFVIAAQATDRNKRFCSNDYTLTYPKDARLSNPCTESPIAVTTYTKKTPLRLVPCTDFSVNDVLYNNNYNTTPSVNNNNNIINNLKDINKSSSSSSSYSELEEYARKLKEDINIGFHGIIDIFLPEVILQRLAPDTESFYYIVDKFINKVDCSRIKGDLKTWAKAYVANEYPTGRLMKMKLEQSSVAQGGSGLQTGASIKRINYDEIRRINNELLEKRRLEIFTMVPRIKEIEEDVRKLNVSISKVLLSKDQKAIRDINYKMDSLLKEKESHMKAAGFPADYLDTIYSCKVCRDTGINEDTGGRCNCGKS